MVCKVLDAGVIVNKHCDWFYFTLAVGHGCQATSRATRRILLPRNSPSLNPSKNGRLLFSHSSSCRKFNPKMYILNLPGKTSCNSNLLYCQHSDLVDNVSET